VVQAAETPDRIEREIMINASIERVWGLVSEPGWWIGDGDRSAQTVSREGDLVVVDDPRYGRYLIQPVSADPPHHVAYRGSPVEGQPPAEGSATLVEFVLAERDGGTLLRVVESGFASLAMPAERRREQFEGNVKGWEMQLGVAKGVTERVRA
jgi:uncharacterized protein YndB with AHSA1/START domain